MWMSRFFFAASLFLLVVLFGCVWPPIGDPFSSDVNGLSDEQLGTLNALKDPRLVEQRTLSKSDLDLEFDSDDELYAVLGFAKEKGFGTFLGAVKSSFSDGNNVTMVLLANARGKALFAQRIEFETFSKSLLLYFEDEQHYTFFDSNAGIARNGEEFRLLGFSDVQQISFAGETAVVPVNVLGPDVLSFGFCEEKGGGSITALPIIETQEGDVSGYIPTNVISITDGQMFLVTDLFNKGIRPAIDVGISVSRVGSAAQTKAMKSVAGGIKLELAQFRELEAFMQFASDLDKATADRIESGRRMVEVLKQKNGQPIPLEKQVAALYAAGHAFFLPVRVNKVTEVEKQYMDFLDGQYAKTLASIRKSGQLSEDDKKALNKAMEEFRLAHAESFK